MKWNVLGNSSLVDRYVNEELHVIIRFRCGDCEEFAACLQSFEGQRRSDGDAKIMRAWLAGHTDTRRPNFNALAWRHSIREVRKSQGKQQFMLVDNVKAVELPERSIPSLGMDRYGQSPVCPTSSCPLFFRALWFDTPWRC